MSPTKKKTSEAEPAAPESTEYARFLKVLGARIRGLRKEHGWSWRDMVVLHDFHISKWQGYESGRYGISLPSLLRISKLFGMTVSELLEGLEAESQQAGGGDDTEISPSSAAKQSKK